MKSFAVRRARNVAFLLVIAAVLVGLDALSSLTLHRAPVLTGWSLFVVVCGLAAYNVRKKFPFLPLISSAAWLQVHIYAGLLSAVLFLLHIAWRVPNGVLEMTLATLYVLVVASGLCGLWMSRIFARRLTTRGEEIIFERIPRARQVLKLQVEQQVLACLGETQSTAIPEFYSRRLKSFFERPRFFVEHLVHSSRGRRVLLDDIAAQRRYLNDAEREVLSQVAEHVRAKDDLDYQYAHQAMLKYWLFVHIPLTYALLSFAVFHVLVVYAFSGGVR